MSKDTYIRVRCTSEVKKQIKEDAKRNKTNMSSYILNLCTERKEQADNAKERR